MHIAIVSRYARPGDGQGRANFEIAMRAVSRGFQVSLLADQVDARLVDAGAQWIPIQPRNRGVDLAYGLESIALANRALRSLPRRPDIVHGYGWTLDGPHDINTAQFVHSAWRRHPVHPSRANKGAYAAYQWSYSALNAWGERRTFHNARRVVAASSTVRRELVEIVGLAPDKVDVVLNGVDIEQFHPGESDRAQWGLPQDVPLGLFTGDIRTGRKNLDSVLKALVDVPEMHLAVVGRLAGSPFPEMARSLSVDSRVHFLDFRKDIADIMRACDFFVFPSRYEACALVLLEALASGLPVVTAETTGGAEVVVDGCGIRIGDTEDIGALARAMRTVAQDRDTRKSMSASARKQALGYTWDIIADQYLAHYEQLGAGK